MFLGHYALGGVVLILDKAEVGSKARSNGHLLDLWDPGPVLVCEVHVLRAGFA
jgi:hypothetical protein